MPVIITDIVVLEKTPTVNLKSNSLLQLPSRKQTPVLSLPENQTGLLINLSKLVCGVKCLLCCNFFPPEYS